jgi:hypothetical protein
MNKLIPNYLYYDYYLLGNKYLEKLAEGGRIGLGKRLINFFVNRWKRWRGKGESSPTKQEVSTAQTSASRGEVQPAIGTSSSTAAGTPDVVKSPPLQSGTTDPNSLLGYLRNAYLGGKGRIAGNLFFYGLPAYMNYHHVYDEAVKRYGPDSYMPHLWATLAAAGILVSPAALNVPKRYIWFHNIARPLATAGTATSIPFLMRYLPFGLNEKILDLYEGSWLQRNTGFDITSPMDWAMLAGATHLAGRLVRFPPFFSRNAAAKFQPNEVYPWRSLPLEPILVGSVGTEAYNLFIHPYANENYLERLRKKIPQDGDISSRVEALLKDPQLKPERITDTIAEFFVRREAAERGKELEKLPSHEADQLRKKYTNLRSTELKGLFDKLSPEEKYEIILQHLGRTRGGIGKENLPLERFMKAEIGSLEKAQIEKERRIQEQKQRLANTARQVFVSNPRFFAGASPEMITAMYGLGSDLRTSLQYNPEQVDLILSLYSTLSPSNYQTPQLSFNPYPFIKAPVNTFNSPIINKPQPPPLLSNVSFDHFATASGPRGWAYSMQRQNFHPLVQHRINDQRARGAVESGLTT